MIKAVCERRKISVLLSEKLMPTDPHARSDVDSWVRSVKNRRHTYSLSDDQPILALKMAIIQDPRTLAGQLTPTSLRVVQRTRDAGAWDRKLITFQTPDGEIDIERTDSQTIGECKNGDTDTSIFFSVGMRPSMFECLWERYVMFVAMHQWLIQAVWVGLLLVTLLNIFVVPWL